jgi:hypothetical protein
MFRFGCIPTLAGLCFLTIPGQLVAASNPVDLATAVNTPQVGMTLHAGIGFLALLLAAIGWFRHGRRQKPS